MIFLLQISAIVAQSREIVQYYSEYGAFGSTLYSDGALEPYNIIDFFPKHHTSCSNGAQSFCCAAKQLTPTLVALQNSLHPRLTNDVYCVVSSVARGGRSGRLAHPDKKMGKFWK